MICEGVDLRFILKAGLRVLQVRFYILQQWTDWKDVPEVTGMG